MRLNTKKLLEIMETQNLTESDICTRTGIMQRSIKWILDNGQASEEATERIAEAVGMEVIDLLLPDLLSVNENAIEFLKDQKRATVTFSQGRYKTRIKNLAKSHPDECEIVAENKDGSLCAHIPVTWIKIGSPKSVSEETRELSRQRMHELHSKRVTTACEKG